MGIKRKKCLICGEPFSTYYNTSKFCGRKCYVVYWIESIKPKHGHKFKHGHVPWNKGVPCSEKTKEKLSNIIKLQYKNGRKPWSDGMSFSKEYKEKLSIAHIGQKSTKKGKTWDELYGEDKAKMLRYVHIKNVINAHKDGKDGKSDTNIERKMENWLLFNNILYVKQFPYKLGVADFWLPENNLIIECDGDYWHKLPGYKTRDRRQTKWLEKHGYIVLRFYGSVILNNFKSVSEEILNW